MTPQIYGNFSPWFETNSAASATCKIRQMLKKNLVGQTDDGLFWFFVSTKDNLEIVAEIKPVDGNVERVLYRYKP